MLFVVGVVLAAGVVTWSRFGEGGGPSSAQAADGELFLEAAASPGTSPFTQPIDPEPPVTVLGGQAGRSRVSNLSGPSSVTTLAGAPPTAPITVAPVSLPTSGVAPPPGSPPYGGTGDDRQCDREKLVAFLTANSAQATAWAGVLGVAAADIATYVRALTPTVLLYDTRVTNHGFVNGKATSLQSVLQAGTAVLVDQKNNPVVRCRCGNPLLAPTALSRPAVRGTPWPGYEPNVAVSVNNGATTVIVINVVNPPMVNPPGALPTPGSAGGTSPGTAAPSGSTSTTDTRVKATTKDVEGLLAVLADCSGGDYEILDVRKEPDIPNTFSVRAKVKGAEMVFVYTSVTGKVQEGDKASAQVLQACGVPK